MRWALAALLLAGCSGPGGAADGRLALGPAAVAIAGQVRVWRDGAFAPAPGAEVVGVGAAGADGGFTLVGARRLEARVAGAIGDPVAVAAGATGVVLPLAVPPADPGGACWVVGVVCGPDGGAVPGATVHCVDSVAGGNRLWTADAAGCFSGRIADFGAGGVASLMAYGRLADGRATEGRTVRGVALPGPGVVVVALETAP